MSLQESADCPTKDDDMGFSSWNVEGSTEERKRSETYSVAEILIRSLALSAGRAYICEVQSKTSVSREFAMLSDLAPG